MRKLLPYRFKRIGLFITPLGILFWLSMQLGLVTQFMSFLSGEEFTGTVGLPPFYHWANVVIATISFFSFWVGLYFIAFSQEKVEDEMIRKTRVESFQFAASLQLLLIIAGFLVMIIFKEPKEAGMMLFFIAALLIFWLSFIIRFNYILHIKINKYEEQPQGRTA